ncbi:glutathione peroxidase [Oxalicibacterium faecigallinarum]|nr:glutathione peroxidase [Oxalicibacterium faecigallinarum]
MPSALTALLLRCALALFLGPSLSAMAQSNSCPATLNFKMDRLQDETPQNLCQYAGKVVLVVNTASYCGFTSQYEGLEKLYAQYQSKGLVVLGFASNDFGQQEPGSNQEIAAFCHNTFGVKFPMFAKSSVIGKDASPFYQSLIKAGASPPKWNFHKILLDRNGRVIQSYPSRVNPNDKVLVTDIEHALAQKP